MAQIVNDLSAGISDCTVLLGTPSNGTVVMHRDNEGVDEAVTYEINNASGALLSNGILNRNTDTIWRLTATLPETTVLPKQMVDQGFTVPATVDMTLDLEDERLRSVKVRYSEQEADTDIPELQARLDIPVIMRIDPETVLHLTAWPLDDDPDSSREPKDLVTVELRNTNVPDRATISLKNPGQGGSISVLGGSWTGVAQTNPAKQEHTFKAYEKGILIASGSSQKSDEVPQQSY